MKISRRQALFGTLAGGLSACASTMDSGTFTMAAPSASASFRHGVASGDPMAESVVLWTRVTTAAPRLAVSVEVAADAEFFRMVRVIETETDGSRDHTVKVIADGLEPGSRYFYRFRSGSDVSPVGRTRTLPAQAESARFAIASCSNYPFGFFNGYDHIARRDDLDAVIHLGDYIYEYGREGYGGKVGATIGREHEPATEIVSLADYRQRHAQYKSDAGAQAMHAAHPIIVTWDDHETTNNSWEDGAQNHNEGEGDWGERRTAALQAYYEWMPVRDPEPGRTREALYRSYSFGKYLTLASIETRLTARTKQLEYNDIIPTLGSPADIAAFRTNVLGDPSRRLMGDAQIRYLEDALAESVKSDTTWRMIANQVIMARVTAPNLEPYTDEASLAELEKEWDQVRAFVKFTTLGLPLNLDAWDGYPAGRRAFYDLAKRAGARDLIVLTGDTHEFWGNDLVDDEGKPMGVELGTSGITSPGASAYLKDKAFDYSLLLRRTNPDVRYHDPMHHGYLVLSLDGDEGQVDFVTLSTVLSPTYEARVSAQIGLEKKAGTVAFGATKGLGFKERVLF